MSDETKKPIDVKRTGIAFSELIREQHNARRVNWVQSTHPDPAVRRQDRDALNDAIRKAGGHQPQHEEVDPEPGVTRGARYQMMPTEGRG